MERELRKFRKKLRGIERLETQSILNDDERAKLSQRAEFQARVAELLSLIEQTSSEHGCDEHQRVEGTCEEEDEQQRPTTSSTAEYCSNTNHKRKSKEQITGYF